MIFKNSAYEPWFVNSKNFPKEKSLKDHVLFFLKYAILAPSTFNSQPWKCHFTNSKLEIYLDHSRVTKTSDKSARFAHLSLGCFIANLGIAAEHFGYKSILNLKNDKPKNNLALKCIVSFSKSNQKKDSLHLFNEIPKRATNRSLSQDKSVPSAVLDALKKQVSQNQKIIIFGKVDKDQIIQISKLGDKNIWTDYAFRKEHVEWVRHNLTRAKDGMPAFGVGIGLIPSLLARPVILSPVFPIFQMFKNIKALKSSSNFATLCSADTPLEWIKLGILFQKISLFLNSKGIAVSPMGQFIEDPKARNMLQEMTQKFTKLPPQMFFRMGFPKNPVRHSPRIPVEEILF